MAPDLIMAALEKCAAGNCDYKCPYFDVDDGCRSKLMMDTLELLKEQKKLINELQSMNISASGNSTAIGVVHGGLIIKQKAKEIYNIKHVEELTI